MYQRGLSFIMKEDIVKESTINIVSPNILFAGLERDRGKAQWIGGKYLIASTPIKLTNSAHHPAILHQSLSTKAYKAKLKTR